MNLALDLLHCELRAGQRKLAILSLLNLILHHKLLKWSYAIHLILQSFVRSQTVFFENLWIDDFELFHLHASGLIRWCRLVVHLGLINPVLVDLVEIDQVVFFIIKVHQLRIIAFVSSVKWTVKDSFAMVERLSAYIRVARSKLRCLFLTNSLSGWPVYLSLELFGRLVWLAHIQWSVKLLTLVVKIEICSKSDICFPS